MEIYVYAYATSPFEIFVVAENKVVHQEMCLLGELNDRLLLLEEEYHVEQVYLLGEFNYIKNLVDLFPDVNLVIKEGSED